MPTAPSFQNFTILNGPYTAGGKQYVEVQNPKTKTVRTVRWYTEYEYNKQYGKTHGNLSGFDGLKKARGFEKGPILVVCGNTSRDEEWLGHSVARYATDVGWYIASTDLLPENIPPHLKFILLGWNEFKLDDRHPKPPKDLQTLIVQKRKNQEWVNF